MTTTDDLTAAMPFAGVLGIELDSATPAEVRARMAWDASRCTTAGILHGGAIMAFADSLGGLCAFLNLPPGATTTTLESKTNMFRAVREGWVTATCRPLHIGRTTIVVQTDLYDAKDRRVAQVTQTQTITGP